MSTDVNQPVVIRSYTKRNCPYPSGSSEYRQWLYYNCYRNKKPWIESYKRKKEGATIK